MPILLFFSFLLPPLNT
uniref:Uncharacterized protein n=1 Tax=Rhizophora mucronata TaxID=61149 RepID=A0A2P2PZN6_RHIMU